MLKLKAGGGDRPVDIRDRDSRCSPELFNVGNQDASSTSYRKVETPYLLRDLKSHIQYGGHVSGKAELVCTFRSIQTSVYSPDTVTQKTLSAHRAGAEALLKIRRNTPNLLRERAGITGRGGSSSAP